MTNEVDGVRAITTDGAPRPVSAYSQGIDAGALLVVSGQLGLDRATGEVPASVQDEARLVMDAIRAILADGGVTMGAVVKTTIFLTDFRDYEVVDGVYAEYFDTPPARSTVKVAGLLKGARVEIEALAVRRT